ncbi:MAG TPA: UDP-glucose/GDP-mannose dehydrogenase family protein [Terriglobia bacterium]|nr:UDP-glucose/GDP-mannose dehydrogenase family protein [Terriglobia bacterium]
MHITVVGSGYVGLVSGAGFADFGLNVTCVDCDEQKIRMLNEGSIPIYEIGLEEIIRQNVKNSRLSFSTDLRAAVQRSLVVFIAVGTPEGHDGEPDMSQVEAVASSLAEYIDDYKVIVTKSTVPVGTSKRIRELIEQRQPRKVRFDVVSNPEFLREGSAIEDFMRPNRVVIGADSEHAAAIVKDIYRPLYLIETPVVITTPETAELIKYASNAFLATKISFVNEIANLCEKVGADIHDVARSMGLDRRIGPKFLHPGPGFGGSCFPKDLSALIRLGQKHGLPMRIAEAASEVNHVQRELLVHKTKALLNGTEGKVVGVLGLSFKPNTDDVRESPAIFVCRELAQTGAKVQAYDPVATKNAKAALYQTSVSFCTTSYDAASAADVLVIATEWNEFRNIDLEKVKSLMKQPIILDSRNIFEPERVREMGFTYFSTGRSKWLH